MLQSLTLSLLLFFCPALLARDLPDVIEQVRGSVVGVGTAYRPRQPNLKGASSSFVATGFVVGNGTQIVTNAHVIPKKQLSKEDNETLAVFSGRGSQIKAHPARLIKLDSAHDLALLQIAPPALPALKLGDSSRVREGTEIAFTGYPVGPVLGFYPATHRGIVSVITPIAQPASNAKSLSAEQLKRIRNPIRVFQLDATAYPGNSGSPVYEPDTGLVIGVINSVFVKEGKESMLTKPTGISYAIPSRHVRDLLQEVSTRP